MRFGRWKNCLSRISNLGGGGKFWGGKCYLESRICFGVENALEFGGGGKVWVENLSRTSNLWGGKFGVENLGWKMLKCDRI